MYNRRQDFWGPSMVFQKMRLAISALILCAAIYLFSSSWFPHSQSPANLSITELEQINILTQEVGRLLERPKHIKNQEIQRLIDEETNGQFSLLYLDWKENLSNSGEQKIQPQKSFFTRPDDSHINLSIPVGLHKVRGVLVVSKDVTQSNAAYPPWLAPLTFSMGVTLFIISIGIWLKARKLTRPIDKLCQQFTKYRREFETKDIDFPDSPERQTVLERRVSVLQDLWIKFQSIQNQLAYKVIELEESKTILEKTIHDLELAKEQERRLVELGYALAEFGHDIGNANGSIMTFVTLLLQILDKDTVNATDVVRSLMFIRKIKISSMAISGLTSDILEFAKGRTELKREVQRMDFFLSQLEVNSGFAADIDIDYYSRPSDLSFRVDAGKLMRVIVNLVKNAWEKLEDQEDGYIKVGFIQKSNGLLIEVRDNGSPIPEEILPQLFQSFQTQGKEKGTGLGLAICKKIIDAHKGSINAENLPGGKGVQFVIYIPDCIIPTTSLIPPTPSTAEIAYTSV